MSLTILIVPSVTKGNGSGHIVRSLALARSLGSSGAVYLPSTKTERSWSAAELSLSYTRELEGIHIVDDLALTGLWDLILLDRRATKAAELAFWERLGPVAALDEGGEARDSAPYLIDVLPRTGRARREGFDGANVASLGFLSLPEKRRGPPSTFRRVLVSFGGEDPAGLSLPLARELLALGLVEPGDLTIVSGALRRGAPPIGLEGVSILGPVQDLKEHLHGWDLVLTQFGLTAFEAAWAGCGVILLNPGPYHRALARAAGFPEIGVAKADPRALLRLFRDPPAVLAKVGAILPVEPLSLAAQLSGLEVSGPRRCPACGGPARKALFRDGGRSYFRCGGCGMVYLTRFGSRRAAPYNEGYFFEEYRRQYGRTYLDDWPNLTALAAGRLAVIEELAAARGGGPESLALLDVGCAYGPFLASAKTRGHEPYGLDISPQAARYVREELGIPAAAGDFADPSVAGSFGGPFDCVSMWYVIEHFADLDAVLRNVSAILRGGGILAFSTPSGEGISARSSLASFLERSPEDHFSVWEPSRVAAILLAHGFRVERIRITGHHPERFRLARALSGGGARKLPRPLLAALAAWSRFRGLGDTFEVYARKLETGSDPAGPGGGRGLRPVRAPGADISPTLGGRKG